MGAGRTGQGVQCDSRAAQCQKGRVTEPMTHNARHVWAEEGTAVRCGGCWVARQTQSTVGSRLLVGGAAGLLLHALHLHAAAAAALLLRELHALHLHARLLSKA